MQHMILSVPFDLGQILKLAVPEKYVDTIYEKLDNQLSTHKSLEDLYLLYKCTQHRQSCLVTNNHHFV